MADRFRRWQETYEQSIEQASVALADARQTINTAKGPGTEISENERHAAQKFSIAETRVLNQLRDLFILQESVRAKGSKHDVDALQKMIDSQTMFVYLTEPNTLEILQAISR